MGASAFFQGAQGQTASEDPTATAAPVVWPTKGIFSFKNYLGANRIPMGPSPNPWIEIEPYQGTITREEFEHKLHALYDPFGAYLPYLDINDDRVIVYPSPTERREPQFILNFAPPNSMPKAAPRWFRSPSEYRAEGKATPEQPLLGLRIAIDPGHIGGPWGQIENRSTHYHNGPPIQEGDLNLITARLLKARLLHLGADVFTVRESTEPVTPYRPMDLLPQARETLIEQASHPDEIRAMTTDMITSRYRAKLLDLAEFLFYRSSEIRERGNRIRNNFMPDLTITIYINATPSSGHGHLVDDDNNIFFVHGCYLKDELKEPEMRMRCLYKLVEHSSDIEREVAANIANAFTENTHLQPVKYGDSATTRMVIPGNLYVVARNLVANREYDGPVVCTEPYFMNNKVIYERLIQGDYEGERLIQGKMYGSFFREYADNVAAGLVKAYGPPALASTIDNH